MIEVNDLLRLATEGHGGMRRWEQRGLQCLQSDDKQ
jgi:hypothetical protein